MRKAKRLKVRTPAVVVLT